MKQLFTFLVVVLLTATTQAQVGVGTTTPDASAALDITSTTKGLLIPRMTAAQSDAITTPSQGLIIFCTNCAFGEGELQIRLTSSWKSLHNGGGVNDSGTPAINHNNKTYSGVSCEGFWLGFKFSVSETQTITALGAWDEGHNIEVTDEMSTCPDASNFSVPIAIYKNGVLVLEKVINASTGFVIGNSRYIKIDDYVLTPGDQYFIIGNYEGSSKFGYFDSNLVPSNYDSRITPLNISSSPLFSKNTNGDVTFPSNLTTLSENQWSDQFFHVNFLLKD